MPPTAVLLALVLVLALLLLGRRRVTPWPDAPAWLGGPALPLIAGLCTAGLTVWIWGGLRPEATWHDEAAYRLQAEMLAHFRLARPGVAIPTAFTQAAVLVTPVVAPKKVKYRSSSDPWPAFSATSEASFIPRDSKSPVSLATCRSLASFVSMP